MSNRTKVIDPDHGVPQGTPRTFYAWLLQLAARVVPHVPARIGHPVCVLLGALVGPYTPAWPHIQANLNVLLPQSDPRARSAAARRVLTGMFKNYFDLLRFPRLTTDQLNRTFELTGHEHVLQALAQGRGLIIAAPHCGNYTTVFTAAVRRFDVRVLVVVEQLNDPQAHQITNRARQMPGIEIAPLDRSVARRIIAALRRNEVVLLASDRAIAENTIEVDFFGRPTPIPSGPATLALRTGAPIMPAVCYRLPDDRSIIHFDPPLTITRSANLQDDIRDVTQKIAYHMQAYIARDPSQWLVAERVWNKG